MGTFARRRGGLGAALLVLLTALVLAPGATGAGRQMHHLRGSAAAPLPTWRNFYDWPNGNGYVGWHSDTTAADDYGIQSALGDQYGLWLWPLGGHKTYDTSDGAEWTYTAPGTTRLQSVTLSYAWTNKLLAHHCIDFGFRDASGSIVTQDEVCHPPPQSPQQLTLVDPNPNPISKVLYFRIRVDCGGASSCDKTIPSLDPLQDGAYASTRGSVPTRSR